MYGTNITIVGNVVDEVVNKPTQSGLSRASFRVASTQRRKDRETGQWVDGHKFFVNVTFWREFAENVAASLKKGDPVVVNGKIYSRQYVKDENSHIAYEIEPESIGHDLARGTSVFKKRKSGFSGSVELDADGLPMRLEDEGYQLLADGEPDFANADQFSNADPFSNAGPLGDRELMPTG
ncbi:single-stranded DNA-binding protein [Jatrophihabitans lederbergiae]|uniref:Single-stranded DNA-binding protein n=1 Tax=Jatrophihabitans lederbergiae TaxID=3075547 RepID=A0ABU2J622_9ACTN|nr:single-stranded DNA-binding protein [Jatrophihabitans sp. DSM 44399]MDT0260446.1 single-stranded DNA-binding protein [Jatrophihabitans sp. DSM 44399]